MNHERNPEADAIESDINITRRRMDDTMDALGDRLRPQHLVDEVLGLFRRSNDNGSLNRVRERITDSADHAVHAVVDTVKANPLPALLIGAGVAWMIYESRRGSRSQEDYQSELALGDTRPDSGSNLPYDPDLHFDRPLHYPASGIGEASPGDGQGESKLGQAKEKVKEKLGEVGERAKAKVAHLRERAGEKLHAARERASELGSKVQERTRETYQRTRERVASTAEHHPLELGLACLAAGLIAGLSIPTPDPVNRVAGGAADRLRERTREAGTEMLEKGKRVARAATTAIKEEAQAQGLTPERLKEKAGVVAERAQEATAETARQPGGLGSGQNQPEPRNQGSQGSTVNPSSARPVM